MTEIERTRCKARAAFFKALSHPVRLLILVKAAERPRCITELAGITEKKEATVSKHVAILKEAGCLVGERKGPQVFCHVENLELVRVWKITDRCIHHKLRRSRRRPARASLGH
jgi:ArsR family transcriptional regulator